MRTATRVSALLGALTLAACVPPSPEPTLVPSPSPTPSPTQAQPEAAPPQVVSPSFDNWMDAPQTPGDWTYVAEAGETLAVFGTGNTTDTVDLILRCDPGSRRIGIARSGQASRQVEMLIRTETQDRRLTASPSASSRPLIVAELAASDPLLDAMAFSKGRFAVEVAGVQPIFVPAWPEVTRVVEDCRN
ncbi:hypothetical protein [Aurantiacibacter poecillastricola]|uniref:hypothetical protein n=1 Tax=Aurantiacibacter poecillastricola TaxID=3064385 RepID=UPI00273F0CC6|nr:hypothetical protein [Aurantiacibacter sp. 219JJ12-13]MDP5261572.1 hypothetical protein [Aurantiacibacter sp. 219JJ12-13]